MERIAPYAKDIQIFYFEQGKALEYLCFEIRNKKFDVVCVYG